MIFEPNKKNQVQDQIDYRSSKPVPNYVKEVIDAHFAIEAEGAKSAGALGFMARSLILATLPYRDPKTHVFTRVNGDFRLRILAGYEGGIPFGIYPRLLTAWVVSEAVRTQCPNIELGKSLNSFLREILELKSNGGGARGTSYCVTEQMKRLFGSLVSAQYSGTLETKGFMMKNILIADEVNIKEDDVDKILWTPQQLQAHENGGWKSRIKLSDSFFRECLENAVPIDLRAYKVLRHNPTAMDTYTWLTFRMSYTRKRSKPIPWGALMMQFGSGLNTSDLNRAIRNFKKQFMYGLKLVKVVYTNLNVEINDNGLVLLPSAPHIPRR